MINLVKLRESAARWITQPLLPVLSRTRVTPNTLTWIGLAINVVAAYFVAIDKFIIGGILTLLSGLFDLLDGALARLTKQTTRFGALLDSTFDRLSEAVLFFGLLVLYAGAGSTIEVLLVFLAMVGSFLTSYIRARAEGLGIDCRVGLFTRAGRVIILALGLLVAQVFIALLVIIALSFFTVGQRLVHVWIQSRNQK